MFTTKGEFNDECFQKLYAYLLSKGRRILFIICSAGFLLAELIGLLLRNMAMCFTAFVCAVLSYFIFRHTLKMIFRDMGKKNLQVMYETYGKESATYSVDFSEESLLVQIQETGKEIMLPYEDLVKIIPVQDIYIMVTAAKLIFPVFKNQFTEEQNHEFLAFLQQKPTKIQWSKVSLM